MKTIFIPVKSKSKVNRSKILEISAKLPKNIAIAYSVQYKDIASKIKNILSKTHKITKLVQVLGCSKPNFSKSAKSLKASVDSKESPEAILLISDGKFHATSLAFETKLPVYVLDHNTFKKISKKELKILEKKQKTSYLKFLNADKIGILVSIKPGQQSLKKALDFKKKLKDKKSYLFLANNIGVNEFENFGLDSWVNTACPRLDMDNNSIINLNKLNLGY